MSKANENIKRFANNHFGNGPGKVPVNVFVMQIHEQPEQSESQATK
ncbi:hypothetical protein PDK93_27395 [Bacillus cereus]|nr:hypothetical protein [Bacillus cereus]